MTRVRCISMFAVLILLTLLPGAAGAQIVNGSFGSGMLAPGWSGIGDALVDNGYLGGTLPTEGTYQALLTTLALNADFTPGLSSSDAVPVNELEGFLGLAFGLLSDYGAVEGSAIRQVFSANGGDTISLDWSFLTDEPGAFGDFAFVVIDQEVIVLADASSPLIGGGLGFFMDGTGYRSFSRVLTTSGAHVIAFGVVDKGDAIGASGLLVDRVVLTPGQPPNRPPVASDQSVTTPEDTSIVITLSATDPDGNPLIYVVLSGPSHGILSGTPPNLVYSPALDYFGPDTFTFQANDGQAGSNIATVSSTVTAVNDAPVAYGQSVTTNEETPVNITLTASDVDSTTLTYSIVSYPVHGTLSGMAPNLTYTPDSPPMNILGRDSFTFTVSDGTADSNTATVSIEVLPPQPGIYVRDLGTLPGGSMSQANAVIDQGLVVGWSTTAGGESHAYLWDYSTELMTDLKTLGGTLSRANDINRSGWVVGESSNSAGHTRAFLIQPLDTNSNGVPDVWVAGSGSSNTLMEDLGTPSGGIQARAITLNDAGQVAGEYQNSSGRWHATVWTRARGMVDLGTLGGATSTASAISEDGIIAGVSATATGDLHAFRIVPGIDGSGVPFWYLDQNSDSINDLMEDLGTPSPGWTELYVRGVNKDSVAAFARMSPNQADSALWTTAGDWQGIGTLGGISTLVEGLNGYGQFAGGSHTIQLYTHAFVGWMRGGLVDLGTLPGGSFSVAMDLNLKGSLMAGFGSTQGGDQHAVLWRVVGNTPEGLAIKVVEEPVRVGVEYEKVISSGYSKIEALSEVPTINALPPGYEPVGPAIGISTSAVFEGNVNVSMGYDEGSVTDESALTILHLTGEVWEVVPSTVNTVDNTVTGQVTSLSPFIIAMLRPNTPPVVYAGPDATVSEGSVFSGSGSFTDPDTNTWSATVDYGDGSGAQPLALTGKAFSLSHVYRDNGSYTVTVSVSDGTATGSDSLIVTVTNVSPVVGTITAPVDPVAVGQTVNASAMFTDAGVLDTHTAAWQWGDGTTSAGTVIKSNGSGTVTGTHIYSSAGVYTVTLTVTDDDGGAGTAAFEYVVVYDPASGFVTGGGWINSPAGAFTPDPALTGKASFGFVSKYKKGATVPTGETEFQFKVANLNFHSNTYEWLVVAGARAQYKGTGTINGGGSYGFMLTAIDGALPGGGGADKFRIKIWDIANGGTVVYDNMLGAADDANPTTVIGGGSIVIHK